MMGKARRCEGAQGAQFSRLHFRVAIFCLFERAITYFKVWSKLDDLVWRNTMLFFEETKFDFFIEPGSTCCVFCYGLNCFVKFQICCCLSGNMNLDILWQGSEAPLTCITFYMIILRSGVLFLSFRCFQNFSKVLKRQDVIFARKQLTPCSTCTFIT